MKPVFRSFVRINLRNEIEFITNKSDFRWKTFLNSLWSKADWKIESIIKKNKSTRLPTTNGNLTKPS